MATGSVLELELDSRGRLPLGKAATSRRYRVESAPDGELHLIPIVSISQRELDFLRNPETVARVRRGIAEAEAGMTEPYKIDLALLDDED